MQTALKFEDIFDLYSCIKLNNIFSFITEEIRMSQQPTNASTDLLVHFFSNNVMFMMQNSTKYLLWQYPQVFLQYRQPSDKKEHSGKSLHLDGYSSKQPAENNSKR